MNYASYIICTSPRSGSTLLCRMLAVTGVAGNPESLFYRPCVEDWQTRMGVPSTAATEGELLESIFQAAIVKGRGGTGVFGLRQQRPSFEFLCRKLAIVHPAAKTRLDCIERAFGPTLFIHLTRPDKLAQAVSYLKAQQSGLWHMAADGSELERIAPPQEPQYDAEKIRSCVDTMTTYDQGWNAWFDDEKIDPVRISYDDLSRAPVATLEMVLERIGIDPKAADGIKPGVKKMADATNQSWIARFREETAPR